MWAKSLTARLHWAVLCLVVPFALGCWPSQPAGGRLDAPETWGTAKVRQDAQVGDFVGFRKSIKGDGRVFVMEDRWGNSPFRTDQATIATMGVELPESSLRAGGVIVVDGLDAYYRVGPGMGSPNYESWTMSGSVAVVEATPEHFLLELDFRAIDPRVDDGRPVPHFRGSVQARNCQSERCVE